MKKRCSWAETDPLLKYYHDNEWGKPSFDDQHLFEMLVLESAQAGLSWLTILKKREGYREAFDHFDPHKIARYDDSKFQELTSNPNIIRNKLKIRSTITNAQVFLEIQNQHGSFSSYLWDFVDGEPIHHAYAEMQDVPATHPLSEILSKDLKKQGFKFVGPTICYSYMQAVGMVNDHLTGCFRYDELVNHS